MNFEQLACVFSLGLLALSVFVYAALLISQKHTVLEKIGQEVKNVSGDYDVLIEAKTLSENFFLIHVKLTSTLDSQTYNLDIFDTLSVGQYRDYPIDPFSGSLQITNIGGSRFSVFLVPK